MSRKSGYRFSDKDMRHVMSVMSEPMMSTSESKIDERSTAQARRAWQAPAFTELKIGTETKSNRESSPPSDDPPPSAAPTTKLGFSIEWAFPLSSRTEK